MAGRMLVLSPHRDDAAFSCGLRMMQALRMSAEILVVNVFTISDYAPYLPETNGDWVETVGAARAAEDRRFSTVLLQASDAGERQLQWQDLRWKDAPLRRAMATEHVVREQPLCNEEVRLLHRQFASLPAADAVLAPLGIGGHIDHRTVRAAAELAFPQDRLLFYEDLPYACRLAHTATNTPGFKASLAMWSMSPSAAAGTKRQLAACYPSQVAPDVCEEMEAYGAALGSRERVTGSAAARTALEALFAGATQTAGVEA